MQRQPTHPFEVGHDLDVTDDRPQIAGHRSLQQLPD